MKRTILSVVLALAVLAASQGGFQLSYLEGAAAPYRWGLVEWEVGNFLNKWSYRVKQAMPWHSPPASEDGLLEGYFDLNRRVNELEWEALQQAGDPGAGESATAARLAGLRDERSRIKPQAEERLEAEISAVLAEEGFVSRFGLIWPPVDAELVKPPSVLALSPRDVIERIEGFTLRPGLEPEAREYLEARILREGDLSALVVDIGGIATYPSIVTTNANLQQTLEIAAHEWLHQFWFFRPLGWNYGRDVEITALNESAADLAAHELGGRAYEAITGEEPWRPPEAGSEEAAPPPAFDFGDEMREIRLETDRLLAEGRVDAAEEYMEERRQRFLDNGYYIRKLNQAYFAFYGTYAEHPASVSPVNDELKRFRASLPTVGAFIREVARFGSYQEFKEHLQTLPADG